MKKYCFFLFCMGSIITDIFAQNVEQFRTVGNFYVIKMKNGINAVLEIDKNKIDSLVSGVKGTKTINYPEDSGVIKLKRNDAYILNKKKMVVSKEGILKIHAKKRDTEIVKNNVTVFIATRSQIENIIAERDCKVTVKHPMEQPFLTLYFSRNSIFEGNIKAKDCFIMFNNKSKFNGQLETHKSNLNFNFGSTCNIEGNSDICYTVFDNKSILSGYDFTTKRFECIASNNSNVQIACSEVLRAVTNGRSEISYVGEWKVMNTNMKVNKIK